MVVFVYYVLEDIGFKYQCSFYKSEKFGYVYNLVLKYYSVVFFRGYVFLFKILDVYII